MDLDEAVALETAIWQALVDGDAVTDAALLSEDFLGVSPTGLAGRAEHVASLRSGPTVRRFRLSEARLLTVGAAAVLLVYRADYERAEAAAATEAMYVSSLWRKRARRWVNVFSQDTPATGVAVV